MTKRTHWWLVVSRKTGYPWCNIVFGRRRGATETIRNMAFKSRKFWKVIKVVAASATTAETKQPWVDVVLRTVR